MAMLSRYQKTGGFVQILKLIETCGKQKQDNFLNMIHEEDPRWADAIKEKMLTIEKIFSWPDEALAEVAGRLQPITMATAKHGLSEPDWSKLVQTISHSQLRGIDDLAASKKPNSGEVSAAFVKIIEEVRGMIKEGYLRVEKFAPELHIEDDIEEKIGKSMGNLSPSATPEDSAPSPLNLEGFGTPPAGAEANLSSELRLLRSKVQQLASENGSLRTENKVLKERLTQIKKLAA